MKSLMNVLAVGLLVALVGCSSSQNTTTSPGAMGECGKDCKMECTEPCGDKVAECGPDCTKPCCAEKNADMGAIGESDCSGKAGCEGKTCPSEGASMGAVGESECSSMKKGDCEKTCPSEGASMGAVSDDHCSGAKKECGAAKSSCGG